MKKLMHILMLSCKKASELIDKKSLVQLSAKENIMLHLHTSMCDACTAYQKQSKIVDTLLENHFTNSQTSIQNAELKEKIIKNLPKE